MAASKRTRFEVLRRDNHTCQYCGESAPNVTLHVDHVMPASLGGSDKPDNLVAACKDCNIGKSSSQPGSEYVAQVSERASEYNERLAYEGIRYVVAATKVRSNYEQFNGFYEEFAAEWEDAGFNLRAIGKASLFRWWLMGMPEMYMLEIIESMRGRSTPVDQPFRYFSGIMWRVINDASVELEPDQAANPEVFTQDDLDTESQRSFSLGWDRGQRRERKAFRAIDFVANHAEQTTGLAWFPIMDGFESGGVRIGS